MPDPAKRGIFKVKMGFITQHSVRMMFEPYGPFEVAEDHYRQEGYEPDFDTLPWQEEQESEPAAVMREDVDSDTGSESLDAEDGPVALEMVEPIPAVGHKPGWLEQSIAKLAASRFARQSPK